MSSANKNLSTYTNTNTKVDGDTKIAIVVAEWNSEITESLYAGAYKTLLKHGLQAGNIEKIMVPGSFELSLAAQWQAQREDIDAVICLGCVIQGDTKHFDFICQAVAMGITEVNLKYNKPVIFGVLTPNNMQQALDRAGGIHGNKGDEAAITAIKMLHIK
jgi:6,7-dimethyl-8-ribityllumazine synthase